MPASPSIDAWLPMSYCVRGFHATQKVNVQNILEEWRIRPSNRWYDWLGYGGYFYQEAPVRALKWLTQERHGGTVDQAEAGLVGAKIRLQGFIDLLNPRWVRYIRDTYTRLQETAEEIDKLTELRTRQRPYEMGEKAGPHPLDRYVIDAAVGSAIKKHDKVKGVRAIFYDGDPIFTNSHLLDRQHIQIAVIDKSVVEDLWEVVDCERLLSRL